MATTGIVWTALPAGLGGDVLRLSVLVSPRLDPGADRAQLASFPVLADWPAAIAATAFSVQPEGAEPIEASRTEPVGGLDSQLWAALFRPELRVRPHQPGDRQGNAVFSYPVRQLHDLIREWYSRVGLVSPAAPPTPRSLLEMLDTGRERENPFTVFAPEAQLEERARRAMRERPPQASQHVTEAALRFWAFHHPPKPAAPLDLDGADAADFADYIDVHQAFAALQSYPALLRAVGLVVDLSIPADALPEGSNRLALGITHDPALDGVASLSPWTAYLRSGTAFESDRQPGMAGGTSTETVTGGYIVLNPQDYSTLQADVEGAMFKGRQLFEGLLHAQVAPQVVPRTEAALPALRSGGVSLVRTGRAGHLYELFRRAAALENTLPAVPTIYAQDLVRGYRADVWDERTGAWHSLLGRVGEYTVQTPDGGNLTRTFVDEATVEPAVTSTAREAGEAPASDADLYLHETVVRWDGWSLAAPRPGRPVNRSADPTRSIEDDATAGKPVTAVPLSTAFRPAHATVPTGSEPGDTAGSLPQLRFGHRYRFRLRAVDLTGNSLPVSDQNEDHAIPAGGAEPYLRYEPVPAPTIVLRHRLGDADPGESLEQVVLRSTNTDPSLDPVATAIPVERHIAPPRSSVRDAELHGLLDDPATGRLNPDPALFAELSTRDAAQLEGGDTPVADLEQLVPPWLPEPLSRGATLRNLPGIPTETQATAGADGPVTPEAYPRTFIEGITEPRFPIERVLRVPFEQSAWPAVPGFRLTCTDAALPGPGALPVWDATARTLTVYLPKASEATVPLSSYVTDEDLALLGVWGWIREAAENYSTDAAPYTDSAARLWMLGLGAQDLIERVRSGGHWMLTPPRTLTLVHAVQQPIGRPQFTDLATLRQDGSALAELRGSLSVHGASTVQVDLMATWTDRRDDSSSPTGYTDHVTTAAVDQFRIIDPKVPGAVTAGGQPPRVAGFYDPTDDVVTFGNGAPVHAVGDTRHHMARYTAVSTSRYANCFPAGSHVTRSSDEVEVSIPSSARPAPPDPSYVVPTFGWQRSTDTSVKSSIRHGGGLRIYLNPSWFSSGEGEQLGVVLWPAGQALPATNKQRSRLGPYVTGWGADPIWPGGNVEAAPVLADFIETAATASGIPLPELAAAGGPRSVDVAGHQVHFDAERGLRYSEVVLCSGKAYNPFIRLALARWQPDSNYGMALSPVVLADMAQLAPDRAVLAIMDPWKAGSVRVTVSGTGYRFHDPIVVGRPRRPQTSTVTVTVQTRSDGGTIDGWETAGAELASVLSDQVVGFEENLLWRGTITLPADRAPGTFRLLVTEEETWITDRQVDMGTSRQGSTPRIVYAEHLPL